MKKHNFTLVEILGVIALIVILMVISAGVYTYASNSAKEKATQATVTRVYNALQLLQDKGFLPVTGGDYVKIAIDNSLLLKINGTVVGADDKKKKSIAKLFSQAIDGESVASIQNGSGELCDAWGQPIYICFPGKFNKGGIDIISAGGDGGFGECANSLPLNIKNINGDSEKDKNDGKRYKDDDGDLICDDISNFF